MGDISAAPTISHSFDDSERACKVFFAGTSRGDEYRSLMIILRLLGRTLRQSSKTEILDGIDKL